MEIASYKQALGLVWKIAITGKDNVTNAIQSIIGLDRNQFTQIAMIAQGDFLKLLMATTKERIPILQTLFRTGNYAALRDRLWQEFKNARERVQARKDMLTKQQQQLVSRTDHNTRQKKLIQEYVRKLSAQEEHYQVIQPLSSTATGKVSGKEHVSLEIYVQMAFFDRIIAHANQRLRIMTDGQYTLLRRTEKKGGNGQDGLELDVIDHWNGTQRSVRSLSGGEAFKASLALALGLSEEIQSSAGGVQLDCMFIDEGFGSLDEYSLRQAMRSLSDLSDGDRLVGIISHVAELKAQVEKQVIVTKDQTGRSTVSVCV